MNTYSASILINPKWDKQDMARMRETLTYKIARETQIGIDDVTRRVTFEERDDHRGRLLVAVLPSPEMRLIVPVSMLRD
jgi:hypothetical protein